MNRTGAQYRTEETGAGIERRSYQIGGDHILIDVSEKICTPGAYESRPHTQNCMEIGFCMSGSGSLTIGAQRHTFAVGDVFFAPGGVIHFQDNVPAPDTRWIVLLVDEIVALREVPLRYLDRLRSVISAIRSSRGLFIKADDGGATMCNFARLIDGLDRAEGSRARAEQEALVYALFARLLKIVMPDAGDPADAAPGASYLDRALHFVQTHYGESIRISDMAAECAMSESHFRKVFFQKVGMTPVNYVNYYRIERAMELLRNQDLTVQEVAYSCGFTSLSTFNRNFARYTGMPPTKWREMF